jgi:hypothetical protein
MDPATQQFFAAQMNSKPHCHSAEFASPAESATSITGTKGQTQGVHEPHPLPTPTQPILWMLMIGGKLLPKSWKGLNATTVKWSCMLQDVWKG